MLWNCCVFAVGFDVTCHRGLALPGSFVRPAASSSYLQYLNKGELDAAASWASSATHIQRTGRISWQRGTVCAPVPQYEQLILTSRVRVMRGQWSYWWRASMFYLICSWAKYILLFRSIQSVLNYLLFKELHVIFLNDDDDDDDGEYFTYLVQREGCHSLSEGRCAFRWEVTVDRRWTGWSVHMNIMCPISLMSLVQYVLKTQHTQRFHDFSRPWKMTFLNVMTFPGVPWLYEICI